MTQLEILQLAWDAQINIWAKEFTILQKRPNDCIASVREPIQKARLKELEELIKAEEAKAQG